MKNPDQMNMYESKFNAICEAYEVLSNTQLRTIYEEYGEEGLRRGTCGPDGVFRGGYQYQGNCDEIFEKFFLESNPFSDLCTDLTDIRCTGLEIEGSYFGTAFKGMNEPLPDAEEDIEITIPITLSEIYNGSRKRPTYRKKCLGLDGRTIEEKQECIDIYVKPGMCESTKMTFAGKGHQSAKRGSSDLKICFKLVDSPADSNAALFKRIQGDCLLYRHKLSLNDAIQCNSVKLMTLDGRTLLIPVDSIPSPNSVKCIKGEGLVTYNDAAVGDMKSGEKRGDLYILFDIEFPG